jgi:hypothetical protein
VRRPAERHSCAWQRAGILLDRGWGKAAQPVTSDDDGGPIIVNIIHRAREK